MKDLLEKEIKRLLELLPKEADTVKMRELALTVESLVVSYTRVK